MTMRRLLVFAFIATPVVTLQAQSNLSTQGFGYPTGQLSARAQGTGGAIGEMDPLSPINPATIAVFGSRILFFQMEPEYRSVTTSNGTERTTTARYPNVFGAMPIGQRVVFSLGSSTLLDRSATTSFSSTQFLPSGDTVQSTTTSRVEGAMNDVRLAGAWSPTRWLRVGLGAHAIIGHNLINLSESFVDSTRFAAFSSARVLGFAGGALSGGFQVVSDMFVASASARLGGPMNMTAGDTVITRARVPNRYGGSLAFTGIANSAISVSTAYDRWASLGTLGTNGLVGVNAWDTSVGADMAGPKVGSKIVFLRAGFRDRTLPFQASGLTVTEKSVSGGVGTSFANERVLTDLALIRASRSAGSLPASEHAWTISFGISVRP